MDYLGGYISAPLPSPITENTTVGVTNTPPKIASSTNAAYLNSFLVSTALSLPAGSAVPVTSTSTATITNVDLLVNFMFFAVSSQNSNGTTGTATDVYFKLVVNGVSVFTGSLPQECANSKDIILNEIIDVTDFFLPKGSTIQVTLGAAATGGNGYASFFNFGFTGISVK